MIKFTDVYKILKEAGKPMTGKAILEAFHQKEWNRNFREDLWDLDRIGRNNFEVFDHEKLSETNYGDGTDFEISLNSEVSKHVFNYNKVRYALEDILNAYKKLKSINHISILASLSILSYLHPLPSRNHLKEILKKEKWKSPLEQYCVEAFQTTMEDIASSLEKDQYEQLELQLFSFFEKGFDLSAFGEEDIERLVAYFFSQEEWYHHSYQTPQFLQLVEGILKANGAIRGNLLQLKSGTGKFLSRLGTLGKDLQLLGLDEDLLKLQRSKIYHAVLKTPNIKFKHWQSSDLPFHQKFEAIVSTSLKRKPYELSKALENDPSTWGKIQEYHFLAEDNIALLEHCLDMLADDGQLIFLTTSDIINLETSKKLRKTLLDNDWLSAVVPFWYDLYSTPDSTGVLLVVEKNKTKERSGKILFPAPSHIKQGETEKEKSFRLENWIAKVSLQYTKPIEAEGITVVPQQELIQNNYFIHPNYYAENYKTRRELLAHPDFKTLKQLKGRLLRGRRWGDEVLEEREIPYVGQDMEREVLSLRYYQDIYPLINTEKLPKTIIYEQTFLLNQAAVLLVPNGMYSHVFAFLPTAQCPEIAIEEGLVAILFDTTNGSYKKYLNFLALGLGNRLEEDWLVKPLGELYEKLYKIQQFSPNNYGHYSGGGITVNLPEWNYVLSQDWILNQMIVLVPSISAIDAYFKAAEENALRFRLKSLPQNIYKNIDLAKKYFPEGIAHYKVPLALFFLKRIMDAPSYFIERGWLEKEVHTSSDVFAQIEAIKANSQSQALSQMLDAFSTWFDSIPKEKMLEFIGKSDLKSMSEKAYPSKEFGRIFSDILARNWEFQNLENKRPKPSKAVIDLIRHIAQPQTGQAVFDPMIGTGSLVTAVARGIANSKIHGLDQDEDKVILAQMNLMLNGIKENNIVQASISEEESWPRGNMDLVLADIPPKIPLNVNLGFSAEDFPQAQRIHDRSREFLFLSKVQESLDDTGKAICIIDGQFLLDGTITTFRTSILKNDQLEAVLQLPGKTYPYYREAVCLLVLNKNKPKHLGDKVLFISTAEQGQEVEYLETIKQLYDDFLVGKLEKFRLDACIVSNDEIEKNSLSLFPPHYASRLNAGLRRWSASYPLIQLKDILTEVKSSSSSYKDGEPVSISAENLPHSFADYKLTTDALKTNKNSWYNARIIRESALLVARNGRELKAAYFQFEGVALELDNSVTAFKVNEEQVKPEFLLLQLWSNLVHLQLAGNEFSFFPTFLTNTSRPEVFDLIIPLPKTKEEQQRLIQSTKNEIIRQKEDELASLRKKLNLSRKVSAEAHKKFISTIRHELNNKLPTIKNSLDTLEDFLNKKSADQTPVTKEELVVEMLEGEDVKDQDTWPIVMQRMRGALRYSLDILKDFEKIVAANFGDFKPEDLDVLETLRQLVQDLYPNPDFEIKFKQQNVLPVKAELDKRQLKYLVSNLIENAKHHGFTDGKKYFVRFEVGIENRRSLDSTKESAHAHIHYQNNGNPFPENFSQAQYCKYQMHQGETGHSGIGGYLIDQAVRIHGGQFFINEGRTDGIEINFYFPLTKF